MIGLLLGALTLAGLVACGVPVDDDPVALDPSQLPAGLVSSQTSTPDIPQSGTPVTLWFVSEGFLVPQESFAQGEPGPAAALAALFRGDPDGDGGLASAVFGGENGSSVTGIVEEDGGVLRIGLITSPALQADLLRLFYGQIVYTVTEFPEVKAVRFTSGEDPLSVPDGQGESKDTPLTRADYASLVAEGVDTRVTESG